MLAILFDLPPSIMHAFSVLGTLLLEETEAAVSQSTTVSVRLLQQALPRCL